MNTMFGSNLAAPFITTRRSPKHYWWYSRRCTKHVPGGIQYHARCYVCRVTHRLPCHSLRKIPHPRDRFANKLDYSVTKRLPTSLHGFFGKLWTRVPHLKATLVGAHRHAFCDMISVVEYYSSSSSRFSCNHIGEQLQDSSTHLRPTTVYSSVCTTTAAVHVAVGLFDSLLGSSSYHHTQGRLLPDCTHTYVRTSRTEHGHQECEHDTLAKYNDEKTKESSDI